MQKKIKINQGSTRCKERVLLDYRKSKMKIVYLRQLMSDDFLENEQT